MLSSPKAFRNNHFLRTGLTFLLFVLCFGCDTLPFAQKTPERAIILQYQQLCGYLTCHQFILSVFSDGTLRYQGLANTRRMGNFGRKLPETEWQFLKSSIESANIWSQFETHPAPDPNNPISEITVYESSASKKVLGQQFPAEVRQLDILLQQLADPNLAEWKTMEENTAEVPGNKYNSMFKIQLVANVNIDYWTAKYYDAGILPVKSLPGAPNLWLIRFDPSRTPLVQLKQTLERDNEVISVELVDKPKLQE